MKALKDSLKDRTVLISFREWLHSYNIESQIARLGLYVEFSSLSESGFIPTFPQRRPLPAGWWNVLISFREWLHSYQLIVVLEILIKLNVLISFREWLHSYSRLPRLFIHAPSGT